MMWNQGVVLALFIEAIVQNLKPLWDSEFRKDKEALKDRYITLGLSVVVTVLVGFDLFEAAGLFILVWAGVSSVVSLVIGSILTGVIVSRGANFVHDLWNRIMTIVKPTQPPQ